MKRTIFRRSRHKAKNKERSPMTRGQILKDFFKNTVLTVVIAPLLFAWANFFLSRTEKSTVFLVGLFRGIPFGIRRMFLWLIPSGSSLTFSVGIIAVNFIAGGDDRFCCSAVGAFCRRMVYPACNLPAYCSRKIKQRYRCSC